MNPPLKRVLSNGPPGDRKSVCPPKFYSCRQTGLYTCYAPIAVLRSHGTFNLACRIKFWGVFQNIIPLGDKKKPPPPQTICLSADIRIATSMLGSSSPLKSDQHARHCWPCERAIKETCHERNTQEPLPHLFPLKMLVAWPILCLTYFVNRLAWQRRKFDFALILLTLYLSRSVIQEELK